MIDLTGDSPSLEPKEKSWSYSDRQKFVGERLRSHTSILQRIRPNVGRVQHISRLYTEHMSLIEQHFRTSLQRWTSMYRAADNQQHRQDKINRDTTKDRRDRDIALSFISKQVE